MDYSAECVEGAFCELRVDGVLCTLTCFVPWRTYIPFELEYAAFVTWPIDAARGRRTATCPRSRPGLATSPPTVPCLCWVGVRRCDAVRAWVKPPPRRQVVARS